MKTSNSFDTDWGPFTPYASWLRKTKTQQGPQSPQEWTGYGKTGNQIVFWGIILTVVLGVGILAGGFAFVGSQLSSIGRGPVVVPAPAGAQAYCPATGTVGPITSPPAGCFAAPVLVSVHVFDAYSGALPGATYSCKFWSPSGAIYEDVLSFGSNGNCTTNNQYVPGTPVFVEVCKLTTSCGSAAYNQQKTVVFYPIPCGLGTLPGGIPCPGAAAGTVSFGTPTTSPPETVQVNMPIERIPGEVYATNTPNLITISWPNATSFTSSNTGFCGTGTKSLGAIWNLAFTIQVGTSGTTPSNPFGAGYAPGGFAPVDQNSAGPSSTGYRGTLTDVLQVEIKETSSTGTTLTPTTGPLTKIVTKPSATPDIIYTVPLNGLTLAQSSTGAPGYLGTASSPNIGYYSFTQGFDCTAVKAVGSVTITITCDYYMYYSAAYVANNFGSANAEAVKTAGTNTVTVKS